MGIPVVIITDTQGNSHDITRYLYGRSSRIIVGRKGPRYENLKEIAVSVGKEGVKNKMFGVALCPWSSAHCLNVGDRFMRLSLTSSAITKDVIEITEIVDGVKGQNYRFAILFPRREAGFCGFGPIDGLFDESTVEGSADATLGLNRDHQVLYLAYEGPADAQASEPSSSFFERIADMASAFQTLITAWTLVHVKDARSSNHLSHDYYYGQWSYWFGQVHGQRLRHQIVGRVLSDVWMESSIKGVNSVYDDRRNIDLISPLLWQIQEDILFALGMDASLAEVIFDSAAPEYWRRTLGVIFEEYYGPKGIIVLTPAINSGVTKYDRRLKILLEIIRTSHFDGERANAASLYKKLAGVELIS